MEPQSPACVFRFGPFEFCPDNGELRKSGVPLKLQPQPARLLELLVSNAGEVVKREQIQDAVWGGDIQVDYDLGVNRCIRQIRSVLLDNPEAPRYIRTIPRRGYSFIAIVEKAPREMPAQVQAPFVADVRTEHAQPPAAEIVRTGGVKSNKPGWGYRLQSVLLLIALALVGVGVVQYLIRPSPAPKVDSYSQLTSDSYQKVIKTGAFPRSISTDGARAYFAVMSGAAISEIAQVALTGGETSIVHSSLRSPILFDFSPSRSQFLLGSGPGIGELPVWIQPLPAGSARRLSGISADGASWSASGEQLAYGSGNGLYIASGSGANSRLLAKFDAARRQRVYWPRWSPDGRYIRFSVYDGSMRSSSLWESSADSGTPHRLFPEWSTEHESCCGSWTLDARNYVFASPHEGRNDIWVAATRSGVLEKLSKPRSPVQLTSGPISYSAPIPGKDGNTILTIGEARRGELMSFDARSGSFIAFASGLSASQADFSRDGKRLAFVSFSDGSLWRSDLDGTERRQLSFPPLQVRMPRWSPDGRSIAFQGNAPNQPFAIYVISEQDGLARRIAGEANHDNMDPDWSADGHQLVFSDSSPEKQTSVLQIADMETGGISMLPRSAGLRSPRWSPDGKYIAALTTDLSTLVLFDVTAKRWAWLASFRMGYPNWSHDSKYIYLVNLTQSPGICRVRISNRKVESVVDMSRRNQYWTDDAWLGLTPQDIPFLSRDISIQQIFALHWSMK